MKIPRIVLPLAALVVAALGGDVPRSTAGESPLRVVTVAGRAEVQLPGAGWSPAKLRADLGPGGAARTFEGRLTLATGSGQVFRLAGLSRLSVPEGVAPDQPTRARLDIGTVWAAVLPGSPLNEQLEVQAGAVSVLVGAGGTEVTFGRDGSALVRVFHGAALCTRPATAPQWSQALVQGQELLVPPTGQPGPPIKIDREKINIDWTQWNEEQDATGGYRVAPPPK